MPSTPQSPIRVRADIPGYYAGHRRAGEEFDFVAGGAALPKWLKPAPADPLAAAIAALDPNDDTPTGGPPPSPGPPVTPFEGRRRRTFLPVIPAKAGIQGNRSVAHPGPPPARG